MLDHCDISNPHQSLRAAISFMTLSKTFLLTFNSFESRPFFSQRPKTKIHLTVGASMYSRASVLTA